MPNVSHGEDPDLASRVLIHLIRKSAADGSLQGNEALRRWLLSDLATKSKGLPDDIYIADWEDTIRAIADNDLPSVVKNRLGHGKTAKGLATPTAPKQLSGENATTVGYEVLRTDLLILTIIRVEYDAVLKVFGLGPEELFTQYRGHRIYRVVVPRENGREFIVHIAMVGAPRDLPCVNVCRDLFHLFGLGIDYGSETPIFLLGIAAGNRITTKLGDVIGASEVIDLEGGRSEYFRPLGSRGHWRLQKVHLRIDKANAQHEMHTMLSHLDLEKLGWHDEFKKNMAKFVYGAKYSIDAGEALKNDAERPKFRRGIIMATEKVLDDGRIPGVADTYNDKIHAADMESRGFAEACNHCRVPWLIFRGISDLGERKVTDGWHLPASVAAATALKLFIRHTYYRRREDLTF